MRPSRSFEQRPLGAVAGAAHVEAAEESAFGDRDIGDVGGEHEILARAREDQVIGVEAVALVDEAALEFLLEVVEG